MKMLMMTWWRRLIGWGIIMGALIGGPGPARAGDDVQTWHAIELSKRLGPTWGCFFTPEVRIRDDASTLFYHEFRQGIRWSPSKHLTLGFNYLFARNASSGKPLDEHAGELDVTPKWSWGKVQGSVRGRLALRTIQGSAGEQEFQLRLMPKVAYPTTWFGRRVMPYLADDAFYDYTRDAWNQNRFYLGVVIPLTHTGHVETSVDLYYMLQHQLGPRRGDWSDNHVLGSKWSVKF